MARISGLVNAELEAVINVEFLVNQPEILELIVDTGFAGTLMIPREFVIKHGLPIKGQEELIAAEKTLFVADRTTVAVKWFDENIDVPAIISEHGYAIVGAEMFIDAILTIDYAKNIVVIEK